MFDDETTHAPELPAPRRSTVVADDGVPIGVREYGTPDAPLTVVFLHGHCLHAESWVYLCRELVPAWGPEVRIVCYDHRGHGSSGVAEVGSCTLDQLGHDLDAVLRAVVPRGPLVLVGHSMGAMAALAYLRLHPDAVGARIVGVAMISSAAGGLTRLGLGRYLRRPTVSLLQHAVRVAPRTMSGAKRVGGRLCAPIARNTSFGRGAASPHMVAVAAAMVNETSIVTMSAFLASFIDFDESATLELLGDIPVLILVGSADLLTPPQLSLDVAARLPHADFVCVEGAGHSVILEEPVAVARSVARLIQSADAFLSERMYVDVG